MLCGERQKIEDSWQRAHILNCPEQFSFGPNGLFCLAEQNPCS